MTRKEEITKQIKKLDSEYLKIQSDISRREDNGIFDDYDYERLDKISEEIETLNNELDRLEDE